MKKLQAKTSKAVYILVLKGTKLTKIYTGMQSREKMNKDLTTAR